MPDAVLTTDSLVKRIGNRTIIDHLSIQVQKGEIFGFLGPNGAGKTTTIKMITGLSKITSGKITVCGKDIRSDYEGYMANIGAIVEEPQLYKYLSGLDNLKFYASMYPHLPKGRVEEVTQITGLQNRMRDKVKTYSLGMRQRLGIAQALLHQPQLLILDEPTNGLDPAGMKEIRDFLKFLCHQYGTTVFVSSHQLAEMQQMCDRVAVIQNGKLLGVHTVAEMTGKSGAGACANIVTDRLDQAAEWLRQHLHKEVQAQEGHLFVAAEYEEFPAIASSLIEGGFRLYTMQMGRQATLEESFIKMTGGGSGIV